MRNNRIENEIESMQLKKLEQALYDMDFSEASNIESVKKKIFGDLKRRSKMSVNKKIGLRKIAVVAAISICGVMQTAVAKEMVQKVIKTFTTEHIIVNQEEKIEWTEMPVPESLKGKLYTADGKEITKFTPNMTEYYTAEGELISDMDIEKGIIITEKEEALRENETELVECDVNKINDYICFKAQLPNYLPEGYAWDRAVFYKDENGEVENSKYISLYFKNQVTGKEIMLQERFADEETAYETGADGDVKEVDINGEKAILSNERNLDWEAQETLFSLHSKGLFSSEELLKMARSIQ